MYERGALINECPAIYESYCQKFFYFPQVPETAHFQLTEWLTFNTIF